MSEKSYLKNQIRLVSLTNYDLFTDEEHELYMKIVDAKNELNRLANKDPANEKIPWLKKQKKDAVDKLVALVKLHDGKPRTVRLKSILFHKKDNEPFPEGASWKTLKFSKKITEFASELSRAMGLSHLDYTFDKVVIKWKSADVLRQLVLDGFYFPVLNQDGTVSNKHYRCFTASSGQLRRDKVVFMSDDMWEKVHDRLECGLPWEKINEKSGANVNKYLAYVALSSSASDEWTDFDIDRCIVIPEFEGEVTDRMMYIKSDYTCETDIRTVVIDHTDGCGMMLPEVSRSNFMIRGPWFKGLLASFDYMRFCKVHNIPAVLTDAWGLEHDLEKEDIQIVFTTSQFKMWKYYESWQEYKDNFKRCGARFCKTQYEEEDIEETYTNYQIMQTLEDMTDDEISRFTHREHERITNLAKNKDAMLRTLHANELSESPYKAALALYPELLREAYTRNQLKDIRKRMLYDAKSGKIKTNNKRLFAIPDMYAACEHWFLHEEHPKGLLENGVIACLIFRRQDKADVLRSPHLYMEHAVRTICHDNNVYEWFYTNGVYTSCHDLISRILQFDNDGDQLNVIVDPLIVEVAERNIKKYDVIPLFYDANKAAPEVISREGQFHGLKRAHDCSGIGEISNMLTRLWNRDKPDRLAAAWLTYYNNQVIDGAKSGMINTYEKYPEVARRISKAVGGKHGRQPHFFQFSRNGRKQEPGKPKKNYAKPNNSTMNRICAAFGDIGNIDLNYAGILKFNWKMLITEPCVMVRPEIPQLFCEFDNINITNVIESQDLPYITEREQIAGYELLAEMIAQEMREAFGPLEKSYPYIVKYLFAGENVDKAAHKQMFWRVYGEIALRNLKQNLISCDICPDCKSRVPSWDTNHTCVKTSHGFFECEDCGKAFERLNSRQCRCEACQKKHRESIKKDYDSRRYRRKKEEESERIISLASRFGKT